MGKHRLEDIQRVYGLVYINSSYHVIRYCGDIHLVIGLGCCPNSVFWPKGRHS